MIYFQGQIDREARKVIAAVEAHAPVFGDPSMPLTLECDGRRWFVIGQHPSPTEHRAIEETLHRISAELKRPFDDVKKWLDYCVQMGGGVIVYEPPESPDDALVRWTSIKSPAHLISCTQQRLGNASERIAARMILENIAERMRRFGWDILPLESLANDTNYPARLTL